MQTIDDVWNKFATQDELAQAYRDWLFKTSPRGMSEYEGLKLYQQPQVNTDTTVLKNFLRGKKMSNDLSRQLCELCGIERKGILLFKKRNWDGTYISAASRYKEFDFESIPHAFVSIIPTKDYDKKNGFEYPYSDIEQIKREYDKNGYDFVEFRQRTIDFTKSENFVRLFNLRTKRQKSYTVAELITLECMAIIDTKNFLENLIYIIKSDMDVADIKQSIREAEWVYD